MSQSYMNNREGVMSVFIRLSSNKSFQYEEEYFALPYT